jgi:hypothetical protein
MFTMPIECHFDSDTILSFDSPGSMVPAPLLGYPLYLMYLNTMKNVFCPNFYH